MRATLETSGGFAPIPGLQKAVTVDGNSIETIDAARLWRLVTDAGFFSLPARIMPASPQAADARHYVLTVEDGARRHSVSFDDPVEDHRLVALRDFVRERGR